jgi:hypothetical protein
MLRMFKIGETAEKDGNPKHAIKAYRPLQTSPKDTLAPGALYRCAQLQEQVHDYTPAAESFSFWCKDIPAARTSRTQSKRSSASTVSFGKKLKFRHHLLGIGSRGHIFASVVRTAPYGKYSARSSILTCA